MGSQKCMQETKQTKKQRNKQTNKQTNQPGTDGRTKNKCFGIYKAHFPYEVFFNFLLLHHHHYISFSTLRHNELP